MKTLFITTVCLGLTTPFAYANSYKTDMPKEYKANQHSESMQKGEMSHSKSADLSVNLRSTKDLEQANTLDRMMGATITSSDNEDLGTISDLVLDQGKIQSVIISTGGFLGMGDDLVAVPFQAVQHSTSGGEHSFSLDVAAQDFDRAVKDGNMAISIGSDHEGHIITSEKLAQKTTASELLGTDVNGASDKTVGTLEHLTYEQDGTLTKAYLTADEVDGLDDQLVEIPYEKLQLVQRSNRALQMHLPAPEAQYDDSVRQRLASRSSVEREAPQTSGDSSYEKERLMGSAKQDHTIEEAQKRQMADARQRVYQTDNQHAERMEQPRVEPEYDRSGEMADTQRTQKEQEQVEQARLEEELKRVIASFDSDSENQAQVRLQTEEGTVILRGEVASEDLKEHIESNVRKLTDAEIRNELQVNSKLAAKR